MAPKILRYLLLASVIGLLLFSSWFAYEFYHTTKSPHGLIEIEIPEGGNAASIASSLLDQKIIRKKWPFLLGYRLFFFPQTLKAGEYNIQMPVSVKTVLFMLTEGDVILYPFTIPEGLTRREIADHLEHNYGINKQEFLQVTDSAESISDWDQEATDLEGYLFPETYRFSKDPSGKRIAESLVSQFKLAFDDSWKKRAEEMGMSIREIVILASLIEKETALADERATISAVFHNRMRIGMKLDCDPTIVYALKQTGNFRARLWTKDLKYDSPYNTYLYGGLPPGPIANPGRASLEAALYPTDENYLYFVSKNDGSHHFSRTFREHQNAVNRYQRR